MLDRHFAAGRPPENRIVDYQIGQNVWRRTGWTAAKHEEAIDNRVPSSELKTV